MRRSREVSFLFDSVSFLSYGSEPPVGCGWVGSNELYDADVHMSMSIVVRLGEVAANQFVLVS